MDLFSTTPIIIKALADPAPLQAGYRQGPVLPHFLARSVCASCRRKSALRSQIHSYNLFQIVSTPREYGRIWLATTGWVIIILHPAIRRCSCSANSFMWTPPSDNVQKSFRGSKALIYWALTTDSSQRRPVFQSLNRLSHTCNLDIKPLLKLPVYYYHYHELETLLISCKFRFLMVFVVKVRHIRRLQPWILAILQRFLHFNFMPLADS